METTKLVLEFLKVLLSPQVIAGIAVLVFFGVFREDIRALMRRIAKIRLPGGSEISTSQAERTSEAAPPRKDPPVSAEEQVPLPQNLMLTPDQVVQVRQVLQAERARAYLWEYRYLNHFLVRHTQIVLDWLASLKDRPTYSLYDTVWLPAIPSADERRAVIDALSTHHLVQFQGDLIEVTPKGREYTQWRRPLPALTT